MLEVSEPLTERRPSLPRQHNLVESRAEREVDATMTKQGKRTQNYVAITVPFAATQKAETPGIAQWALLAATLVGR